MRNKLNPDNCMGSSPITCDCVAQTRIIVFRESLCAAAALKDAPDADYSWQQPPEPRVFAIKSSQCNK